jgi:putative transcriptional regulator
MAKTRYRSDAAEAVHSAALGLYRAQVIDKKMMREYDDLCVEKAPEFSANRITRIRQGVNVSQGVFCAQPQYHCVDGAAVGAGRQEAKRSSGIAA